MEYRATICWERSTADFAVERYNRAHEWVFESGVVVPASAAPEFRGDRDRVDPESALVAAISSCHMLTFLFEASRRKYVVDSYRDSALGVMTKNERGKLWVSRVTLRPAITFSGDRQPSASELAELHHRAHEGCFIAQSVKTDVQIEAASDSNAQ